MEIESIGIKYSNFRYFNNLKMLMYFNKVLVGYLCVDVNKLD